MPGKPWGVRSIPEIDSRYPLWDQPNFVRDVDEGRFYLPDAEEGQRETLVTTAIDAQPVQCLRLPGTTFLTLWAALSTGGVFIFGTFHWWWPALRQRRARARASSWRWLWTGTALIPEKPAKDVGLGLTLPLYASGPASVGWWAMFITMLGDLTAFVSLVFGYFFYWTIHAGFPARAAPGPACFWPSLALAACCSAPGLLTLLARAGTGATRRRLLRRRSRAALLLALAGGGALLAGPWLTGLDPAAHVYAAIVWMLVIWTALHAARRRRSCSSTASRAGSPAA